MGDRILALRDGTYGFVRQVSIYLSPNLLIRKIVTDRPDRYRNVDLSPFYCFSVEQRRSKTARLGTINSSSSPFIIHAARPSSPAENPRKRRCLSALCPKKLKVDGLNNKVVNYLCVFDAMRSSSLQCLRDYWANNRSATMRIDTYRGAQ